MNIFEQLEKDRYAENQFIPKPLKEPTTTLVGTEDRIAVYASRLEQGVELWHEEDNESYSTKVKGFKD